MDVVADGESLTIDQVVQVARQGTSVRLVLPQRFYDSRRLVESGAIGTKPLYGVNTGFGLLATIPIPQDQIQELQRNLLMSHAAGVGEQVPTEICRAMLLLRLNALAKGYSGVRAEVVQLLADMLNRRIHPVIPAKGSVGASGDLAPLAHLALVMIGLGEAEYRGHRLPGSEALERSGLRPLTLEAKEVGLFNALTVESG